VRPEAAAGADLVGVWPRNPNGHLFITFSHAWYSRGVTEEKGAEHKKKGDIFEQYSHGMPVRCMMLVRLHFAFAVPPAALQKAWSKKRKAATRAGPDPEPVTEMTLANRALLVRAGEKHECCSDHRFGMDFSLVVV
jgi:hypothetical protein